MRINLMISAIAIGVNFSCAEARELRCAWLGRSGNINFSDFVEDRSGFYAKEYIEQRFKTVTDSDTSLALVIAIDIKDPASKKQQVGMRSISYNKLSGEFIDSLAYTDIGSVAFAKGKCKIE